MWIADLIHFLFFTFTQRIPFYLSTNETGRNGDNGARGGDRGSHRGRAPIPDILKTKPAVVNSKRGAVGNKVVLTANYFRVLKKPTWQIYQYRVDFNPPIESDGFKKKLISEQKANLGGYLFDGTVLYLTVHLNQGETVEFMTKDERDDNKVIVITVKFVKTVSMMEGAAVQILNLILRRSMNGLKLQLVGRNFFDALSKVTIASFKSVPCTNCFFLLLLPPFSEIVGGIEDRTVARLCDVDPST